MGGEIPYGDEIRHGGGWVDLISSAKQISSEHRSDFIAPKRDFIEKYDILIIRRILLPIPWLEKC